MATEIFLFAKNVTSDSCEGCIDFYATLNPWARAFLKMGFALSSCLACPDPWALTKLISFGSFSFLGYFITCMPFDLLVAMSILEPFFRLLGLARKNQHLHSHPVILETNFFSLFSQKNLGKFRNFYFKRVHWTNFATFFIS